MRGRLLALLMTLCAPLGAWAGGAETPMGAGAARLHLPLGEECLPGSWVAATVVVPPRAGALAPALAVWEEGAAVPSFTHELPPREFATAQALNFRLVAPRRPAKLALTLRDARGREVAREEVGALLPSASPTRLHPTLRSPLPAEEFYRPCTSVFIPAGAFPAAPALSDCQPLLDWVAAGGQALCADSALFALLTRLQSRRPGSPAPGRAQRFALGPGGPAVPFRLCGRGILADVGGQEAALPQLREKLRRGYAPWAERRSPDWRLAPGRRRALGAWPGAARVAPRTAALWLGGWLSLAVAAAVALPPRWRLGGVAALTAVGATAFLVAVPAPGTTTAYVRFYDLTDFRLCRGEFLTVAVPAADGEALAVPLPAPAVLLAADGAEIAAASPVLRELPAGAPAAGQPAFPYEMAVNPALVRRGVPLLLSLARAFPAMDSLTQPWETPLEGDEAAALCGPLLEMLKAENPPPPYTRNVMRVSRMPGAVPGRSVFAVRLTRAPTPEAEGGRP